MMIKVFSTCLLLAIAAFSYSGLSLGLKYTNSNQNLLNLATRDDKGDSRPLLPVMAGESCTEQGTSAD